MPFFATAGSKVYIGGVLAVKNADFVVGDFSAITWVEIKELDTIGTFGDTSESITHQAIGQIRDQTIKGTRSSGSMELGGAIDYADAGQLALIAAEKSRDNYAFKIEFNDAPSGASPTPSERMFVGLVMNTSEALEASNNVMKLSSSITINSNIVRVAAAPGA